MIGPVAAAGRKDPPHGHSRVPSGVHLVVDGVRHVEVVEDVEELPHAFVEAREPWGVLWKQLDRGVLVAEIDLVDVWRGRVRVCAVHVSDGHEVQSAFEEFPFLGAVHLLYVFFLVLSVLPFFLSSVKIENVSKFKFGFKLILKRILIYFIFFDWL